MRSARKARACLRGPILRLSLACGLLVTLGAGSVRASENLPAPFEVIPQPKKVVLREGPGLEPAQLERLVLFGETPRPVMGRVLSRLPLGKAFVWPTRNVPR